MVILIYTRPIEDQRARFGELRGTPQNKKSKILRTPNFLLALITLYPLPFG